jgi:hypothetical protein
MKLATVAFKHSFSFGLSFQAWEEPRPQLALLPSPHHWTNCWVLPVPWHLLSLWDWSFMYPWNPIGGLIGSKKASWDHLPLRECYIFWVGKPTRTLNLTLPDVRTILGGVETIPAPCSGASTGKSSARDWSAGRSMVFSCTCGTSSLHGIQVMQKVLASKNSILARWFGGLT